jgi:serine/threonine-protein kinase
LAAAAAWLLWKSELMRQPVTTGIAVLPFENLSGQKEDGALADGVQDDILTKLAKIGNLKVISRTSVMEYRSKRNLHQIGNDLRVSHVLEGSVRRTGTVLHMNAQLIDTRTDTHVWAEEYDRDLGEMFAIQSEIAQKVADQLHAQMSASEKVAIEGRPTADLTAFDLYTRAKNIVLVMSDRTTAELLEAVDLLNQAVARDPSFFDAYCKLAETHDFLFWGEDHTAARLALAEAAIQVAARLRPDAGETHLVRAENLYRGYRDYEGAIAELELARRTLPNDVRLFQLTAAIQRRQGYWQESTRNFERCVELNPRGIETLRGGATNYDWLRRYADQKSALARALAVFPNDIQTRLARASVELDEEADIRPLHQMLDSIRATNPAAMPRIADSWLWCAVAERDATAAKNALDEVETPTFADDALLSRSFLEGFIARMTKDEGKAQSDLVAARAEQEKIVQAQPNNVHALCGLGLTDAYLGRKEDALREGRHAVELLPVEKDAVTGVYGVECLALIAAWIGDRDLAFEQLDRIIRLPSPLSYGRLKLNPFWDPLRSDPRFEKLLEKAKQPVVMK